MGESIPMNKHAVYKLLSYFKDLGEHESGSVDLYYKRGEEYTLDTARYRLLENTAGL
jgi:hypothetical protein